MKLVLVPGYESLFGKSEKTYEQWLEGIPSRVVISLMIMLNAELNAPLDEQKNQRRLREFMAQRFSRKQLDALNEATKRFLIRSKGEYSGCIFGRRYLLSMLIKELGRNISIKIEDTTPEQEFNILMAYLMVVDEVHQKDTGIQKIKDSKPDDPVYDYRLLWTSQLNQFLFNERPDLVFELFKVMHFVKFANQIFPAHLKQYVKSFGLKSFGSFIHSLYEVAMATLSYDKSSIFSKLSFITPVPNTPESHLQAMTINDKVDGRPGSLRDLKMHPLYYDESNRYMVIDHDLYAKKMYKGLLFDLRSQTALTSEITFTDYSSKIALEFNERIIFRTLLETLKKGSGEKIHFDDRSDSVPDAYVRKNRDILLIEYKAYQFPDSLLDTSSFEELKNYFDTRFIANEKNKAKGITQIINQIELMLAKKFEFDPQLNGMIGQKRLDIYPVICFDDYYFSLPGFNEYLNKTFQDKCAHLQSETCKVHPVTLMNLTQIFDFGVRQGTFKNLILLIERYHKIMSNRHEFYAKTKSVDSFLRTKSAFDEIYQTIFAKELKGIQSSEWLNKNVSNSIGLVVDEMNREFED